MPTPSTIWTGMESLALEPVDELLGEADRLGHPVGAAREHPADRRGQRDPVADGHVERANVVARSEDGPDPLALERRGPPVAAGRPGLAMPPDEARLGAPDAGPVQEHSEVGGEAEASRVGDPLAVEEPEVGPDGEAPGGLEKARPFPEGQVARNVRKPPAPRGPGRGHRLQARKGHDGDAGPDGLAGRREGALGAGDEPDGP